MSTATKQFPEGASKVLRTQSVDDRIDGRVTVTEPEEDGENPRRSTISTEGTEKVNGKERTPTDRETADDDADRLRRFLLSVESSQLRSNLNQTLPSSPSSSSACHDQVIYATAGRHGAASTPRQFLVDR